MTEKEVLVTIDRKESFLGEPVRDDDCFVLTTEGTCSFGEDSCTLFYEESEITGMGESKTQVLMEKDGVTVTREGDYTTQLFFREGQRCLSVYETPFGSVELEVYTVRLKQERHAGGGEVSLYYRTQINRADTGDCSVTIRFEEKKNNPPEAAV